MIYRFGGRALLADQMGLGKTIQSLYWILRIPKRRPVIIVTPASVKWSWREEAMMHFGMRCEVIEGRCKNPNIRLRGEIFIVNYDILTSWIKPLKRLRAQVLVMDECHFVKNVKAQRTIACRKLGRQAASVLALSGTPLTNRPEELWSILNIVRPDIFPDRAEYLWRYCEPRHTRWGWIFPGAKHLGELHRILHKECMIRRLKKDVAKELPDKIHKVVPFELKNYSEYNRAKNDFLSWLAKQSPSKAKRAKKNQALTKIGYLLRLCAQLKRHWVIKWLKDFKEANPGRKLVCMTMHTAVIKYLKEAFPKDSVVIDGKTKGSLRQAAVRSFQNNKRITFLFGNWKAAGVGLTLTAAHEMASLDFPWTPGDLSQGQDRVHRIGQTKQVIIYYLLLLGTIEENLMKTLQKKQGILDAVLDGKRAAKDFDLVDALLKAMKYE